MGLWGRVKHWLGYFTRKKNHKSNVFHKMSEKSMWDSKRIV